MRKILNLHDNRRLTRDSKMSETKPSETKPKKMVRRSVAVALGIICIILVAGLGVVLYMGYSPTATNSVSSLQDKINQLQSWLDGNKTLLNQTQTWLEGNITNYNSQISDLQNEIASLNSTYNDYVASHQHPNSDYNSLQSTYNNYVNDHSYTNEQYANLQSQIADLEAPNLIEVNLKSDDNHPFLGTEYLHVYGEICNVGTNTAYNCKLHVVAYQSGGVVAFDTLILLGTISGKSWTSVDASKTYSGSSLTSWTITPQWTATP
jgi:hypothetical protein